MDKEKVKQRLDNLVLARKIYLENEDLTDELCVCTGTFDEGIHIHLGIEKVADVMGFELTESHRYDDDYPYTYYFVYDGVKFFQIGNKKLERLADAGTD